MQSICIAMKFGNDSIGDMIQNASVEHVLASQYDLIHMCLDKDFIYATSNYTIW